MAYLIGPSEASRLVYNIVGTQGVTRGLLRSKALRPATYYVDPDPTAPPTPSMLTQLAPIKNLDGAAIPDSTVTIDAYSLLPLMRFPEGTPAPDSLLIVVDGGPPGRVYAREDDRLDGLEADVAALQAGGGGTETPAGAQSKVDVHSADTTGVHGIADTSLLETQTGAQTKATAAQSAAVSTAAADATSKASAAQAAAISASATDATTKASNAQAAATAASATDATAKVTAHTNATDPHGDRAAAASDATTKANAAQTAAVSTAASDATTKANAAQAAAISAAATDATSKVAAEATARGNADALLTPLTRTLATTAPLTGGGDLSTNRTLAVSDAAAGSKGVVQLAGDLGGTAAAPTVPGLTGKVNKGAQVIDAGDYAIQGTSDGTFDSTAGFIAALTALRPGYRLIVPPPAAGQHYKITDALLVPVSGVDIDGGGRGCEIRQYTRTYKPVFDCLNVDNVSVHGFTFTLNGGPLSAVGSGFRAENAYTYCAGVWSNGSGNTFYNLRVKDFVTAVTLSAWDGVSAMSTVKRVGNTVRELEISGVNFGILFLCQDSITLTDITTYDTVDSSSGANPLHAMYCTGNSTLRSSNVVVADCTTKNITFGAAYQFKYIDGLSASNLVADNCQGILTGIDLTDATFSNLVSRGDTATQGSFWLQKVTTQCARVTLNGLTVKKAPAAGASAEKCANIRCDDFRGSNLNLFPNYSTRSDGYTIEVSGAAITLDGVKIRNIGTARSRGVLVGGAASPTSDVLIANIETSYLVNVADFEATITGTNVISYDPGMQANLEVGNGISVVGSLNGSAAFTASRREHVRTTSLTGGATGVPTPFLETTSRFVVGDATAFTVAAPDRAAGAKAGMTHEIVIVNDTAGALGAITWNAAYALRSTFVPPPAGEAHLIAFMFNGTTWREIGRSSGAATDVNSVLTALAGESLAVGEIIPARSDILTNAVQPASGVVYMTYFVADKSETVATLTAFTGAVAAAATPTLCRMGIYSVAGNGDLTLVASTANDTSLFATVNTAAPKALSTSWNKVAGQRYATAILVVSGATMPSFHGVNLSGTGPMNTLLRQSPPVTGRLLAQTDLASSISAGSLVGWQAKIAIQLG